MRRSYRLISQSLTPLQNPNPISNFLGFNPTNSLQSHVSQCTHFRQFSSSQESKPVVPSEKVSSIVNELMGLTLLESADLTELLRKKMNITEMPIMAVMMPGMGFGVRAGGAKGSGAGKGEAKSVEKTVFDLKLEGGFDAGSKIKIIKEVRTFTDLGLKEAKDLVEKAPTLLKKGVTKEEAEKIIEKMKGLGAKVTME